MATAAIFACGELAGQADEELVQRAIVPGEKGIITANYEPSNWKVNRIMTELAMRLRDELLQLSEADRLELANMLWDSLDGPRTEQHENEAQWAADIERRFGEIESGQAVGEPARRAIEELREECK